MRTGICLIMLAALLLAGYPGHCQPLPEPNAFDWYVKAGTLMNKERVNEMRCRMQDRDAAALQLKADVLKENAAALATLREGMQFEYRQPPSHSVNDDGRQHPLLSADVSGDIVAGVNNY